MHSIERFTTKTVRWAGNSCTAISLGVHISAWGVYSIEQRRSLRETVMLFLITLIELSVIVHDIVGINRARGAHGTYRALFTTN